MKRGRQYKASHIIFDYNMATTCFVCCEDSQYWTLPPCNHTHICWKCCLKLVDGSIFSCPFCKDKPEIKSQLLFVTTQQMEHDNFQTLMQQNPYRSNKNTYYFYSNTEVAEYIEAETSFHCVQCGQVHQTMNLLKKHLYSAHRVQFCDVCLQNRKCMMAEQRLYTDYELTNHLKEGEASNTGEISLYHPQCEFCARRFYDLEAFKLHLKMSSHLKCQICDLNCPKLKFVYYKNFEELQRHHRKSHFVCDVGDCITRKLQNVFASEALLQQHKRRVHRKYKGDKQQKVDNIILGFNKKEEEEFIEFDGIGKDLTREFTVFELQGPVQKEVHNDEVIDLREFYSEIVKANLHAKIQDIVSKVQEMHDREGIKNRELNFAHLPLYKPLEMTHLAKFQCERLLRRVFPQRDAQSIAQLFFTKKNEYRSPQQYIQAIQRKMRAFSSYAFFIAFPQLIRNLKPENKVKALMDQFYASSLKKLPVNRLFIFHEFDRYSALIQLTKSTVEEQVCSRLNQGEVDLEVYAKFLREMSANYYVQRHEEIFWVSKQKMTHLYHMIERCKTKDFLKMNWLLKVGLSNPSYNLLSKFYYSTRNDLQQSKRLLQPLSLQQLSLLNAYLSICLQSLLDIQGFQQAKKSPKPHYLTTIIQQMPLFKKLSKRQLEQLRALEGHSHAIVKKNNQRRFKGYVIDQTDCPSLLAPIDCNEVTKKPKIQKPEVMLGKGTLPTPWNEERAIIKKKLPQQKAKNQQEFPTLANGQTKQELNSPIKKKGVQETYQKQEDFPVFNFNQKYVSHKLPAKTETNNGLNNWVNFNNKEVNRNYWDEDRTRKKWKDTEKQAEAKKVEKKDMELQTNSPKKKKKKEQAKKVQYQEQEEDDKYLRMAIEQSLLTAKQENSRREADIIKPKKEEIVIIPKKNNKIEEEDNQKSKRRKRPPTQKVQNEIKTQIPKSTLPKQLSLFERIELQENQAKNRKSPFRRDISDQKPAKSEVQKSFGNIIQSKQPKILSTGPIFDDDDFIPLGQVTSGPQESIVTRLIKQSQLKEDIEVNVPKQRNKKKKYKGDNND